MIAGLGKLHLAPLTQQEAQVIADWRYEPPYDFYDARADHRDLAELLDPERRGERYFAVRDERDELVGYFGFGPGADGVVGIGIGLRPDLTDRGLGRSVLEEGVAYAGARFQPRRFRLSVAAFNARAITVYERAGFVRTRSYRHELNGTEVTFVELEREA